MATLRKPSTPVWMSPEGGLVLLAAVVTAAVASMPLVLVPGFFAYGILVYLRYTRVPDERQDDLSPTEPNVTGLAPPYAHRALRTAALQRTILEELGGAAAEHRALLTGTADRVRQMVTAATRLAGKLQALDRHIGMIRGEDLARETRALERKVAEARDPQARDGYARALAQQQQQANVYQELLARRERLEAQLISVEKTLETAGAQVVRIKSTEGATAEEGARIAESLDALAIATDAAAETVDEAAAHDAFTGR